MSTDRPSGALSETDAAQPDSRPSDLPRQTLPAMTPDIAIAEKPTIVSTRSGCSVAVLHTGGDERVEIRSATGEMILSMRITEQGPVFSLAGASFEIAAANSLSFSADTIHMEARNDLRIEAAGTLRAGGRDVEILAEPGQVAIRANDDVDIVGERVRLNSEDPPMPQSLDEHRARHAVAFEPFAAPASPPRIEAKGGGGDGPATRPRGPA
jgi:hypothetical protein